MIELVEDRVQLRDPTWLIRVKLRFPRTLEALVAIARKHERDEVLDGGRTDPDDGRLGDEPFRTPRQLAGAAIAPEKYPGSLSGSVRQWQVANGPSGSV